MMDLLRFFSRRADQLVFASPAQDSPHNADLDSIGVRTQSIKLNCESFDRFCQQLAPDIVLFDRFMMEEQFGWRVAKACPDALRILDTEDLHCLRDARHRHLKQTGKMLRSPSLAQLNGDLAQRELAAIWRSDLTLIISPVEVDILVQCFQVSPELLHETPLWVPSQRYVSEGFAKRRHFVSIGSFRHAPNWDSVRWVNSEIWPAIRRRLPDAELHIYGSYPPPKATALHNPKTGFLVKGWADEALPVLAQARVCLAPLRFGAGIKGKFVDAVRAGTPSVTTDIGREGLFPGFAWPGSVANSAEEIVEAAVALYQQAPQWQAQHVLSQKIANQAYQVEDCEASLAAAIERVSSHLGEHRANNFIGAMLRHQSLRATQYMSQWIEQKQLNQTLREQ